jgi:hypothetical protein
MVAQHVEDQSRVKLQRHTLHPELDLIPGHKAPCHQPGSATESRGQALHVTCNNSQVLGYFTPKWSDDGFAEDCSSSR